jgi:branched-chain amino acid transport system permease protein
MDRMLNLAIASFLLAGLYALMAYGLGVIYGVLRVVNLAHGGIIMGAAYLTWVFQSKLHVDPYLAAPIVLVFFFGFGVALYQGLVRFLPQGSAGGLQSLLLLFGVWLVMRNIAYLLFTGNDRVVRTSYSTKSLRILGSSVPQARVVAFVIAVVALVGLTFLLRSTYLGRAVRAVAQNPDSASLVGINVPSIYRWTFGLGSALAALAGLLLSTIFSFNPAFGATELLKSFVIVVLGGLGSIVGIGLGALLVAAAENYATLFLPSYLTGAVAFVLLVVVLLVRPGGLFGQRVLA